MKTRNQSRIAKQDQKWLYKIKELQVVKVMGLTEMDAMQGGESTKKEFNSIMNNNTVFAVTGM